MILSRSQLSIIEAYISHRYKFDAVVGYQELLDFLQEVFDRFHSGNKPYEKQAKTSHADSGDTDKYQQIQFKLRILKKLEEQEPVKLSAAFDSAFDNNHTKFIDIPSDGYNQIACNATDKKDLSLSEFSGNISLMFTHGLFSKLNELFQKACNEHQDPMDGLSGSIMMHCGEAMDNAKTGDLPNFIKNGLQFIDRLNKYIYNYDDKKDNISSESDDAFNDTLPFIIRIGGYESLRTAFQYAINQAIEILAQQHDSTEIEMSPSIDIEKGSGESKDSSDTDPRNKGKEKNNKKKMNEPVILEEKGEPVDVEADRAEEKRALQLINSENKISIIKDATQRFNQNIALNYSALVLNMKIEGEHPKPGPLLDADSLANIYDFCNNYIMVKANPADKLKLARRIRDSILSYYTPHFASDYITNPAFILAPDTLKDDKPYQALLVKLTENLASSITGTTRLAENHIKKYRRNRGGFSNYIRDTYRDKTSSHPGSKNRREIAADNLSGYLSRFAMKNTAEGIEDLNKLLHSYNRSAYGNRADGNNQDMSSNIIRTPSSIKERSSYLKQAVYACINEPNGVRGFVNNNYLAINCLLAGNSGINKQEFYFQLNVSINRKIKAQAKESYNTMVNHWWRKPIEWITFSKGSVRDDRKKSLNKLMNNLSLRKTEDDYVSFLYEALNLVSECTGRNVVSHISDSLYTDTIRKACLQVVSHHIVTSQPFKLNYTAEQLQLVEKILHALKLQHDPVYHQVKRMINRVKSKDIKFKDVDEKNDIKDKSEQEIQARIKQDKEDKIALFKTQLLSKLESNLLADIVIGSNKFVLKDKDIGLLGQAMSLMIANSQLPGGVAAAAVLRTVSHTFDDIRQVDQGQMVGNATASYKGAFSLYWNEIALVAITKLTDMFADEIGRMSAKDDINNFVSFCFARIYDAIIHPDTEVQKQLGLVDYLIASVFTVNKKIGWVPGRKDHYSRVGDNSWYPKTTFQGLVDNVGFACASTNQGNDEKKEARTTCDIYLAMQSLSVRGNEGSKKSKLTKYGVCSGYVSPSIAEHTGRAILVSNDRLLDNIDQRDNLDSNVDIFYGRKQENPKLTQLEFVNEIRESRLTR